MPCSSHTRRPAPSPASRGGFTLVEVIVLVAVGALLVGLLIPALGASQDRARVIECATRLQQLGVATSLYLNDFSGALPQVLRPAPGSPAAPPSGPPQLSPLLFGGKRGTLARDGIDELGVAERPLNRYVTDAAGAVLSSGPEGREELEAFRSPTDRGGQLTMDEGGPAASIYDRFGTSYVLNDRLLRASPGEPRVSTLIPLHGGPMPPITTPDRTWMLGSFPIHNHDLGVDRRAAWYGGPAIFANLLTADMHVRSRVEVAPGAVHTTRHYSFLPAGPSEPTAADAAPGEPASGPRH